MTRIVRALQIGLTLVFVAGCGPSSKLVVPEKQTNPVRKFEHMKEDFDPAAFDDDDLDFGESEYSAGEFDFGTEAQVTASEDSIGDGFRIQILQTTEPEVAKEIQKEALFRFEDEIYRVFEPPYYKVRVGDFVNWSDAEKIQKLAIQKGFNDAWVIRTKINLRKAYKWIDEL